MRVTGTVVRALQCQRNNTSFKGSGDGRVKAATDVCARRYNLRKLCLRLPISMPVGARSRSACATRSKASSGPRNGRTDTSCTRTRRHTRTGKCHAWLTGTPWCYSPLRFFATLGGSMVCMETATPTQLASTLCLMVWRTCATRPGSSFVRAHSLHPFPRLWLC